MGVERNIRFFRNGRNQAVRIPREFEMPGVEGTIRKEGDRLVIEAAARRDSLEELLDRWAKRPPLGPDEQMPEIESLPAAPVELFDDYDD